MAKYKYRNTSKEPVILINFGKVEPGEIIFTDTPVENENMQPVSDNLVGKDPVTPTPKKGK